MVKQMCPTALLCTEYMTAVLKLDQAVVHVTAVARHLRLC